MIKVTITKRSDFFLSHLKDQKKWKIIGKYIFKGLQKVNDPLGNFYNLPTSIKLSQKINIKVKHQHESRVKIQSKKMKQCKDLNKYMYNKSMQ